MRWLLTAEMMQGPADRWSSHQRRAAKTLSRMPTVICACDPSETFPSRLARV
jgi:hypothetical protein